MRHRNHSKRLGKKQDVTQSMLRNMLTSVLLYERVRTTKKRANVVKGLVDRVITIGKTKRTDLAIRQINTMVTDENACRKILEVFKQRYANRRSGFTRITPLGMRGGDGALLCEISLIDAAAPQVVEQAADAPKKTSKKTSSK
jgi:large subunit ribosomal protein L17